MRIDWQAKGIEISKVVGGKTFCPNCHATRKNKRDRSLSVDLQKGLYNCHNVGCGFSGSAVFFEVKKEYKKPLPRLQKVSDGVLKWFEGRGISNNTLLQLKVTGSMEWMPECEDNNKTGVICFNYYRGEELVNIKFRSKTKGFRLEKDAELIMYNLNALEGRKEAVIVEGEIDCLTLVECGIYNVVSVPNGASIGRTAKLEYLDNCWREFEGIEKIVIATDGDEAGECLKQELVRRLGWDKCYTVEYPKGCKDANEVLNRNGKDAVLKLVSDAQPLPLEGVDTVYDLIDDVRDLYHNGYPETLSIGYEELDKHIRWMEGDLTIITGIPNAGKSTFLNNILIRLAKQHGWKAALFSPEKMLKGLLISEMAQIYAGKPFYRKNPSEKMSQDEMLDALNFLDDNFFFLRIDEVNATVEGLIEKAKQCVKRYGIRVFVSDPWNYLEHHRPAGMNETEYISEKLTEIKTFCKIYRVHWFLVAHPTKIKKNKDGQYEVPTLYDISGSAHFFNKCDNGLVTYRDYMNNCNVVYVQKVRWFFVGQIGNVKMWFDVNSQRFTETPPFQITDVQRQSFFRAAGVKQLPPAANYYDPKDNKPEDQQDLPF